MKKYLYSSILTIVIAAVCATIAFAETEIRGKLLGADGKPMRMAHVHLKLWNANNQKGVDYPVAADGNFSFKAGDGFATLEFSGVDHKLARMNPVYLCGEPIAVSVQLATNTVPAVIKSVDVTGEFNGYTFEQTVAMSKQPDGTYSADIPYSKPMMGYQLIIRGEGITEDNVRSINGTQSEKFEYDGTGDYISFAKVQNGKAHIVFNPALLAKTESGAHTNYTDDFSKRVQKILSEIQENRSELIKARMAKQQGQANDYNPTAIRNAIRTACDAEKNPRLKELLMLKYLDVSSLEKESQNTDAVYVDEVLRTIPPDSRVWEYGDYLVLRAIQQSSNPVNNDYLQRLLAQHPAKELKGRILYNQLYTLRSENKKDEVLATYKRLQTEYGDTRAAESAKKEFNPDRAVQSGKKIPEFAFMRIDDTTKKVTPATLKGKWVLIDNWATWCGPCVGEMPILHQVYEKFKDKNFEIMSVSFDASMNDIARFRNGKWKMPWLHVFSPGVWKNEATKIFEVTGIPKPILINPDGVIVSLEGLRGGALEQTLAQYLK